jgi:hypothetical protein
VTRRKLLRVVEIAEILGVSKQRADQLRREPDFRRRSTAGLEGTCGRPADQLFPPLRSEDIREPEPLSVEELEAERSRMRDLTSRPAPEEEGG